MAKDPDFSAHLTIETAGYVYRGVDRCGQGYCAYHVANPNHDTLTRYGWQYSHTTAIRAVDGSRYAHHTYRYRGTDRVVGIDCRPGWLATAHSLGDGRSYPIVGVAEMDKYLRRKTAKIRRNLRKSADISQDKP